MAGYLMTGPSDWERGDVWRPEDEASFPEDSIVTHEIEQLPETVTREAWDIASLLVADYLDEVDQPHREDGTSESYLLEAKRALRLHELDPGHTTWTEVIGFQSMIVRGTVDPTELRKELARLGLYVMQWLHDLNEQEDADAGEVQAG
jgi:hypothetical protein